MLPGTYKPHFFADDVHPFRLSEKEIAKADDGVVVVSRPQPNGTYLACAINVANGLPIGTGLVVPKQHLSDACQDIGRSLHKFYGRGGNMADAARHRRGRKEFERVHGSK